jgi:hypothetical protein
MTHTGPVDRRKHIQKHTKFSLSKMQAECSEGKREGHLVKKPKVNGTVCVYYDAHQGGGDTKIGGNRVLSDEKSRCA